MRARVTLGPAEGVSAELAESHLALLSRAFPMDPVVEKLDGEVHLSSSVIDAADLEPGPNFFDVCRAEFFALSTAAAVTFPGLDATNITIASYQGTIDHGMSFTIGHIAAYGIPATVEQSELDDARLLTALARSREPWARLLSLLSRRDRDTAWFDLYGVYELLSVNIKTNRWVKRNTTDLDLR